MDILEGSVAPLTSDQTLELLKHLENTGDNLLSGVQKALERVTTARFRGRDVQAKAKQDFHALLATADREFVEHVQYTHSGISKTRTTGYTIKR